jgi:hypothetical protein
MTKPNKLEYLSLARISRLNTTYVTNAGAYPSRATSNVLSWLDSWLKRLTRDKGSSLFWLSVNGEERCFLASRPETNAIKLSTDVNYKCL